MQTDRARDKTSIRSEAEAKGLSLEHGKSSGFHLGNIVADFR